jgi:XTP/dITP diphosphohydrolase
MTRGYPKTDMGQCGADFGREQGDAEEAILREACPEAATRLQNKICAAMAFGSFRIASRPAKFYLASANPHKAVELQALADAGRVPIEIVSAREVGGMPAVTEDAGTFEGNARKKAVALRSNAPSGSWVLADDSGLCVDALDGRPGVESAYYAGPQCDSAANLSKLVQALRDVPARRRGGYFVCVLFVAGPSGEELAFEGRCNGRLLDSPRGAGGFGYDPLFVPDGYESSFAELGEAVKNRVSHRARAWEKFAAWARQL